MRLLVFLCLVISVTADGCAPTESSESKSTSVSKSCSVSYSGSGSCSASGSASYSGSGSVSGSCSASGSGSYGSYSGSFSWSMSGHYGHQQHYFQYFHARCCDPCSILHDFESEYYQECGQFWRDGDNKFESMYNQCNCLPTLAAKVQLLATVRDNCYKEFGVLIHFQCPRVQLCEAIQGCDIKNNKILSPAQLVEVCTTKTGAYCPPKKCDECAKLTDQGTLFYQTCGQHLDPAMLNALATRCKEATSDAKKAILWLLYGRCRCIAGDAVTTPDPCQTA